MGKEYKTAYAVGNYGIGEIAYFRRKRKAEAYARILMGILNWGIPDDSAGVRFKRHILMVTPVPYEEHEHELRDQPSTIA